MEVPMQQRQAWPGIRATRHGIALLEVLLAIAVSAIVIGTSIQFYATVIKNQVANVLADDRTAAIASDAGALDEAGRELLSRTGDFVTAALAAGSVDADAAAQLRTDYEQFAADADALKRRLEELRGVYPRQVIERLLGPVLAQARRLDAQITLLVHRLSLLESDEAGH
jgi:hypothetical protein